MERGSARISQTSECVSASSLPGNGSRRAWPPAAMMNRSASMTSPSASLHAVRADEADRAADRRSASRRLPRDARRAASSRAARRRCAGSPRAAPPGRRSRCPAQPRAEPVGGQLLEVAEQSGGLREHARRRTPVVRARATRPVALHERHARPELRRAQRRRGAGGPTADDDQVEVDPPCVAYPDRQAAVDTLPAASMYTAASSTPSTPSISLIASSMNAPMPHAPSPIDVAARYAFSPTCPASSSP